MAITLAVKASTEMHCMSVDRITLDANILIYAIDKDANCKQEQAVELIEKCARTCDCVLTSQALAEFYFAATRKGKASTSEAKQQIADWQLLFPTILPSIRTVNYAINAVEEHSLSFWDAMLWSVANENAVKRLYSENFQPGAVLKGVEFLNPFL